MDEIAGILCGLLIGLTAIAVVGHLIWIAVAAAVRWLSGANVAEEHAAANCPACAARLPVGTLLCYRCGHRLASKPALPFLPAIPSTPATGQRDDQAATLRHLARLHQRGWMDTDDYEGLVALVREAGPEIESLPSAESAQPSVPQRREAAIPATLRPAAAATAAGVPPIPPSTAAGVGDEEIIDAVLLVEPRPAMAIRPLPPPVTPPDTPAMHALDRDYAQRPVAESAARRQVAEVMQAFMADKNIRWGELIAGLLIVGSAVGLVISLRATLSQAIPYFPALIFMLITLAIYGAGMYTLRRWNLRTTSRGVLTISLLLLPLNFLAAIIMSGPDDRPVTHPVYLLAVVVGLAAGGWITYSAGRALSPFGWWRLTTVVLATSVGQLFIDRLARPGAALLATSLLAALPLGGFLVATVSQIRRALPWWHLSGRRARQLFLVLGISLFALAAPLGLLISKSGPLRDAIAQLGPAFSLVAAVVLATGLLVHRRIVEPRLAAMRTTGTALAVGGAMLMAAAVVFAWPSPELLIAVGLTNGAILVLLALRGGLPILHVAAAGCLALASLVAFHAVQGNLAITADGPGAQLLKTLLLGRSSVVLTVLALICGGVAMGWGRANRRQDAVAYLASAAGLAGASLGVALWAGFISGGDRNLTTPVFAFYTAATILAAAFLPLPLGRHERVTRQTLAWTGSALLLVTLVHGLCRNTALVQWLAELLWLPKRPLLAAVLTHADLCAVLALLFAGRRIMASGDRSRDARWQTVVNPLAWSAMAAGTLAVPSSLWVRDQAFGLNAGYLFAAAGAWLAAAVLYRRDEMAAVFHGLATIGIGFLVAAYCHAQSWGGDWWADPRHLQCQWTTLAAWCAAWSVGRRLLVGRQWPRQLLGPQWLTVNEAILSFVLLGVMVLALTASAPGVAVELGFSDTLTAGATHGFSYAGGSWVCLTLLLAALLAQLWNRLSTEGVVEFLVAAGAVPLLIAPHWQSAQATASALRWAFAGYVLVTALGVWRRASLAAGVQQARWLGWDRIPVPLGSVAREAALLIGGVPIVLLTTIVAARRLGGLSVGAVGADSVFGWMGTTMSYAVPLLVLVAILVGHAIRERNTVYTLAGSVLLQYVACLAYALQASPTSPGFLAGLLQWNAVALGGYAWIWLGLQRWMQPVPAGEAASGEVFRTGDWAFAVQLAAAHLVLIALAVWAAVSVFLNPGQLPDHCEPLGGVLSYVAWVLALGAGWPAAMKQGREQLGRLVGGCALALAAFLAVTIDARDASRMWAAYHVLTYGVLTVAAGWTAAAFRRPGLGREAAVLCGLVAMLAVRGTAVDPSPGAPWWSVGAAAGAAALSTVLALARRSQGLAFGSVLLAALAASIGVIGVYSSGPGRGAERVVADFVQANLIALAGMGVFWLVVEFWYQRRRGELGLDSSFRWLPVHVAAGILSVAIAALFFPGSLVVNSLARASGVTALAAADWGGMLALGVLGTLLVGALWEQRRGYGLPCLYVWGALVIALVLDRLGIKGRVAFWAIGMSAGVYATLTSLIWRQGVRLASVGSRWGIRDPIAGLRRTAIWLPTVNLSVAAAATFATLIVVSFFPERWMRISSGMLPAALAIGLAALAQQERRTLLQFVSLLMTGVAAVCLSWADLQPDWSERLLLLRVIRVVIVLAGLTFVYGLIVVRRVPATSAWLAPVQRIAMTFGSGAGVALVAVLLLERLYYVPGVGAPVDTAPMLVVAVVLAALLIGLISLALLPDRGGASLTERQRRMCVYGAEVIAALIFAHLFMCRPGWFAGVFRPYWPYIVMAIAFAGVGVGELFQRSGIRVLSDPLQRTGAFLPLIPALGFWVVAAEKSDYSVVLFAAGLVYLVLSMLRRSMASGMAALVAGNAALWSLLMDTGFAFWRHPQFWLIPPAASVLIAGHLNRRHLKPAQLAALRYAGVLVIYLSSTSEIFLRGVGESLWPPMVLASLSVAGVFLGIIFRVRAFLYLGTSFVLLSVVTMVWHAARAIEHVWPWWAFGIGLGICILVLFGLFEKKRPEITAWARQLQQWEQ
jgi:hypothetical protein